MLLEPQPRIGASGLPRQARVPIRSLPSRDPAISNTTPVAHSADCRRQGFSLSHYAMIARLVAAVFCLHRPERRADRRHEPRSVIQSSSSSSSHTMRARHPRGGRRRRRRRGHRAEGFGALCRFRRRDAWWGLRAYNAAYATATGNVGVFRRSSDSTTCTGKVNSSGDLDLTTAYCAGTTNLPAWCAASSGSCFVATLYDQSGALACGGSGCDLTQATAADQPALTFSCLGSLSCMTSTSSIVMQTAGVTAGISQPFTLVGAAEWTGSFAGYNGIVSNTAGSPGLFFKSANNADFYIGADNYFTATENAWHVLIAIGNGTSSSGTTDGTTTALSLATTAFLSSGGLIRGFNDSTSDGMTGNVSEFGVWPGAFSGGNIAALNSNVHSYYGF